VLQITTPPASTPAALVTATARAWLGADAADDTRIQALIEEATRTAEDIAGRRWIYRVYQERIVLDQWSQWLYLQARPVASVTSVAWSDDALVEGTDSDEFSVWPRGLYMEDGWIAGRPGWLVTYAGGYWLPASMTGTMPTTAQSIDVDGLTLRRAIWEIVHATWERDRRDATLRGFSKSGASASFAGEGGLVVPPGAVGMLGGLGGAV
jgi:hypothetical protein